MGRCLRYLRTAMALCAVVAYALPAATHAVPPHEAPATPQAVAAAPPCHGHVASDAPAGHSTPSLADVTGIPAPATPAKCPAHKDGATSCCVAMCHVALPLSVVAAPWLAPPSAASAGRIVDSFGPTLIMRLDRPPKSTAPPHG